METENFIEHIGSDLGQSASINNVYGEPIQAGDKTIIPVARITYGFGGGYGQGSKMRAIPSLFTEEKPKGEGAGGGGGIYAKPKGVYEITPKRTRFIPANGTQQLFIGMAVGFLIKALLFSKKKK